MTERHAIFLGSKHFGLAILSILVDAKPTFSWRVIHPDDREDERSALTQFSEFCAGRGIPFQVAKAPSVAHHEIRSGSAEIVFVCGWYFLLPVEVLSSGPRFFGIHNSLLPKYRGGAPLVWAMIRGEPEVGSTLFGLTSGTDDGPIYLQVSTAPGPDSGIADALLSLETRFLRELPQSWEAIATGSNKGLKQDEAAATHCGQRQETDGQIDWCANARAVHDFIRAQSRPYPGAFTFSPAGKVRIWRARPAVGTYVATPGQVLRRGEEQVLVACGGDTALTVLEAEGSENERQLPALFPSLSTRL